MGGLIILQESFGDPDPLKAAEFVKAAFGLIRENAAFLMASAENGGSFLASVTFLGGSFGLGSIPFSSCPVYAGLAGIIKTANIEWKKVLCRALDLPDSPEQCMANAEAAVSLIMTQGEVEMGLDGDNCNIPMMETRPLADLEVDRPDLNPGQVAVFTGGARGVTAECAIALAEKTHCPIALLGRSPAPFDEPEWAEGVKEPAHLKKEILAREFQGQKPKPTDIEKRYQALVSNRQIQSTLARITQNGSKAGYFSVDIRDKDQVHKVFDSIRKTLGPVNAIVHGAGVLEDRLITDKHPDQFARVFDTKTLGLKTLMSASETDSVRFHVFFSSIAARTGNQGQSDYAAANEVLNKTARKLALENPESKVISINWGPWDGGMVTPSLKKEFQKKGVDLIPLAAGARQMILEMANPDKKTTEVVIGAGLSGAPGTQAPPPGKIQKTARVLSRPFSLKEAMILKSHQIDRQPVVPFALMIELMAHGAEKDNPGLVFAGMDDMRLLKGIRPGTGSVEAEVNIGRCRPSDSGFTCAGTLTSRTGNTTDAAQHARGVCILKNDLPKPPVLSEAAFMDLAPYSMDIDQAYEKVLFHGRDLQLISDVKGVSRKGIEVVTGPAPAPGQWYAHPHAQSWSVDPMILDAAFQAAILWTFETRGQVCLPSYMANLRVYASQEKNGGSEIRILFTVNEENDHKIKGYFTFLDQTGTVTASITGFEAVIDPLLLDKFKPRPLFPRESILAFAQGLPSQAFGDKYKIFDQERQIARLPRPPYFFVDRVLVADHPQWKMQPGGWIETEYDIPENAWYFDANRTETMPFCILLEIALQPCGWLAAYAGSALESQERLHFRNLGGKACLSQEITRNSGTLTIRIRMTDVSKAGGMIIQDFDMEVLSQETVLYRGTTNFGFFTAKALANQIGIRNSDLADFEPEKTPEAPILFEPDAPVSPDDDNSSPNTGMPAKALRMIDKIQVLDLKAGKYEKGYVRASKKVDPNEWFFHAHFYQDPVCPGSLGIESFIQLIRFFMLKKFNIQPEQYQARLPMNLPHEWIYRGQIIPANKEITVHAHIRHARQNEDVFFVQADGALCVDGICIYEMKDFSLAFEPRYHETVQKAVSSRSGI